MMRKGAWWCMYCSPMVAGEVDREKLQRFSAFWNQEPVDRPLIGFALTSALPSHLYVDIRLRDDILVAPEDISAANYVAPYEKAYTLHQQVEDDIFWVAEPLPGFPWIEAMWGCPIRYSQKEFWAEPFFSESATEWEVTDIMNPVLAENPWYNLYLRFCSFLSELSGSRFPVGQAILRGPSDLLVAMRGSQRGILDLYDRPDKVHQFFTIYVRFFKILIEQQFSVLPRFHNGYTIGSFHLWAPGRCIRLQEDASILFSPSLYREFLLPYDKQLCSTYEYSLFHLHSSALFLLDSLLEIEELQVVQLLKDVGGPSTEDLLASMKRIQEHGKKLLVKGEFDCGEIALIARNINASGLYLLLMVDSVEVARELYQFARRLRWGK